jgi:hypothetical protein
VGEDKMVKCWDLEINKVIRHYHGHLRYAEALERRLYGPKPSLRRRSGGGGGGAVQSEPRGRGTYRER